MCCISVTTDWCNSSSVGNCGDLCIDYNTNYLAWAPGGIGRMLVFLAIQGLAYFILLFLIESQVFQQIYYAVVSSRRGRARASGFGPAEIQEDSDVALERQRINTTPAQDLFQSDALVLSEISKYYGRLLAVDCLSLGIPQGECFGLLGVNGAGKTTTFKMLTGDEVMSSGEAWVKGISVTSDIDQV